MAPLILSFLALALGSVAVLVGLLCRLQAQEHARAQSPGRSALLVLVGVALMLTGGAGGAATEMAGRFWATAPSVSPNNKKTVYLDSRARLVVSADTALISSAALAQSGDFQGLGAATGRRLGGFAILDSGVGAGAEILLRHGTADTDPLLVPIAVGRAESTREFYFPGGIECPDGVFVEINAGTVDIVLFRPPDRDDQ